MLFGDNSRCRFRQQDGASLENDREWVNEVHVETAMNERLRVDGTTREEKWNRSLLTYFKAII